MAKLSVVLATFNEEKNLPDCLQSIKNIAQEIIIVDGSSQDKTVEIAKSFGAKIVVRQNEKIFHINKQKAIDLATGDWVLQLDADERVTPSLAREIEEVINNKSNYDGFWIPRKNWFLGRYLLKGGVYPDYTLRLYKKGKGRLPMKDVHEQAEVSGKVGYLKSPIEHLADPSFSRYLLRFNRYADLMAVQLKEKNKNSVFLAIKYLFVFPVFWFFKVYVRHLGFMDGWQGLLWAFFSSLRFPVSYFKSLQRK
jgi:glycosyltransferase involved in cell wall biosynthesis